MGEYTNLNITQTTFLAVPELTAEGSDLPCHALATVVELLQFSLELPLLSVGARVLLLHLLQLPLQLFQADHRLIQLSDKGGQE